MTLDIGDTIAPDSTQLDAVDLAAGERTFTVKSVRVSGGEQPVNIYFEEFDRPWRPSKNMRRVLNELWGEKSAEYVGRRITLFCDNEVMFGGRAVGGIRIRAMSHVGDKARRVLVLVSQGKTDFYPVRPLRDPAPTAEKSLTQRIDQAVAAYARASVTVQMLEARLARPRDEWDDANLAELEALYARLAARETTKEAEFDMQTGSTS